MDSLPVSCQQHVSCLRLNTSLVPADKGNHPNKTKRSLSTKAIPYILATADLMVGLASGMTIKFFPIFFLQQVGLPPVGTNFVMAGSPLAVAIMSSLVTPKAAQYLGMSFSCSAELHLGVRLQQMGYSCWVLTSSWWPAHLSFHPVIVVDATQVCSIFERSLQSLADLHVVVVMACSSFASCL